MAEIINLEEYIMDCRNCRYHSERDGGKCTYPGGWQWDPVKQRCGTFRWKNGNPIRVENAKREIERAAIENGLNLTVYEGKIGFVDQGKRKIVALWEAKYRLREESGI